MEHTKGEWKTNKLSNKEMTFKGPYVPIRCGGALMMFDGMVAIVGGINPKQAEANAQLIAAAPDLLAACRLGVLTMIEQHKALVGITKGIAEKAGIEPTPIPLPPIDLINEAIAKAEKS